MLPNIWLPILTPVSRSLPKQPLTDADRTALTGYAATQARIPEQSVDVTFG